MKEFAETLVIFNKKSYPSQVKESFEAIHQFWLKNHNHPNFEGIIAKACGDYIIKYMNNTTYMRNLKLILI